MLMRTKESHVFFLLLPPPEAKFNAKLLAQRSYRRPILPRYVSVFDFFSPASPTLLLAPVRKVTGVKFRSFRWKTSALCFRYDSRYFKAWIMASETTNSVRIRSTIVRKSQRGYTCVSVDVSYIYIYIEKRKSAYALVFRNVFHRRCPRCDGQTYEKRWNLQLSCTFQFDIACNGYTRLPLFVFARLHLCVFTALFLVFSRSFYLARSLHTLLVHCLPPFVAQERIVVADFWAVATCHAYVLSAFILHRVPLLRELFQFILFKISVAPPETVKSLRRQIQSLRNSEKGTPARTAAAI